MNSKFAYGADLGWLTQFEANGIRWADKDMNTVDPVEELKGFGVDSARLRVFVNPPKTAYWQKNAETLCMLGYCDTEGVLAAAKRFHASGLRIMVDFHYSDHFADPGIQDIPEAWKNLSDEELHAAMHDHTVSVLTCLRENGVTPEWVQVGNEINYGFLWPRANIADSPEFMTALLNTGYNAVKEVFPDCKVITHMACLNDYSEFMPFLDTFFANGGLTDIIGFSFYPYWFDAPYDVAFIRGQIKGILEKYGRPILIAEVGGEEVFPDVSYEIVRNTIEAAQSFSEDEVMGIFYWEPEAGSDFLPDHYPLGAAAKAGENTLRFTRTMEAYRDTMIRKKLNDLRRYLQSLGSVAVAFSGGVDSTFLLKTAHDVLGDRCIALTARSESFPEREMQEAIRFCEEEGIRQILFESGEMQLKEYANNPKDRCYHCKHLIFSRIKALAAECGMAYVAEGSNMDDLGDYRPGLQAIRELDVASPLREVNLYKSEIRMLSREMGLPTWDKPSFACLASRFAYGEKITPGKIRMVGRAEEVLREMGLKQYRVRIHGNMARIEVLPSDFGCIFKEGNRERILREFKEAGFSYITMDLQGYRTGSMNEVL